MIERVSRKRRYFAAFILTALFLAAITLSALNTDLQVSQYTVESTDLPTQFDNYKIAQISDLHAAVDLNILDILAQNKPDAIFFTGDIIDEYTENIKEVFAFLKSCCDISPCFYVTGNHEQWTADWEIIAEYISDIGINIIDNRTMGIARGNESIYITGLEDPSFMGQEQAKLKLNSSIGKLNRNNGYNILLFHRADMLSELSDSGYDIIFSGHLHGGQIRVPLVGGIISPSGEWMPQYTCGKYRLSSDTAAIVSRGLANNISFPRLFNRYQLIFVTLKCGK